MARDMFKFVNTVGWKNDLESFRKLKREVRGFKKEMDSLYKGMNKSIPSPLFNQPASPRIPRQPRPDKPSLDDQQKFIEKQEDMIRNFFISNRQMRELSDKEREQLELQLKSLKTLKDTRFEMRRIKATVQDRLANERKNTREMEQQNALAKRMNASYLQMGTSIASAYTALAAGQSIVQTGIAIESINKTLLSVTGSTQAAAEEMKFLEAESLRLGLSLKEGGKAYAKLLAAGKGKLELQEIRDTFTAVSEAGTVLGLSQDDMAGGVRAIQQMMSKGKVMAEELTGQLGERIPTAVSAMARAAKDAGLTVNGTEAELFKMMEQGKVLAKDILPEFAKQLRKTAHDGGALTHALDKNLSVAIGQATFNLQQMSNAIFTGGLKDALKVVLDSFNLIAPRTKDLAFLLGKTLGGAVEAVTFPFVLFGAVLTDAWTLMKRITGVNDEMGKSLLGLIAKVGGLVLGFKALFSIMKKVAKVAGIIKTTSQAVGGAAAASSAAAATGTTVSSALAGGASLAARVSPVGALIALGSAKEYDPNNPMFTPRHFRGMQGGNHQSSFQPRQFDVNVTVEMDQQGNFIPAVKSIARDEAVDVQNESLEQMQNSLGGYN